MRETESLKLMIIHNYIDWFTSNEDERKSMKHNSIDYVLQDHVDEIKQYYGNKV
jgi:hypothetical protein